ncbi:MAG: DUF2339 domain-containing protein [Verrucomicrobiales bacterium]|nr:DUF2339 domain-containing protein [Verrucomicrobiales bacterium]
MLAFILSITFLVVFLVSFNKLSQQIRKLHEELTSQKSKYSKLKDSTRQLKNQLTRIEKRIAPLTQEEPAEKSTDHCKPVITAPSKPTEKTPEIYKQLNSKKTSEAQASPPPLPSHNKKTSSPHPTPKAAPSPAPAPHTTPQETAEPSFFSRIPWRAILEKFHLWPPSQSEKGASAETQLASWWAIRGGLVIVIIAAVFSGIYVSQHTPPILRVLALLTVSAGTILLGTRMKNSLLDFGRAITGGGFALLYFTAFAAYALPATKIIQSPAIGVFAQLAALLFTITWSLWKKAQSIATLTLLLGFISCAFSHQHELEHFALLGLILLAATAAFLFAQRGWLTSFITALAGSWIAYASFILLDWRSGDAPSFATFLAALITLTLLFEGSNLLAVARKTHPLSDRWRRWLILSNTSVAAVLGYALTRLIYPEQLSSFYFIFALIYFFFTLIHYVRSTDQALTETLFLKSSALLCLGFASASAFDGPVRWLAIAFQSFALLWTARRSHSRWIALGFAAAFAASIAWFWRDLMFESRTQWLWVETFRIAGFFYLLFLTAQLALHRRWFPAGIGGSDQHLKQSHSARWFGALIISLAAINFAMSPATRGLTDPLWFMLLLSLALASLTPLLRVALPCIAAIPPLFSTYIAYAFLSNSTSQSNAALLLGTSLIALAFIAAEVMRRYWPQQIKGKQLSRDFILITGLSITIPFVYAIKQKVSISPDAGLLIFALIPLLATAALLIRQNKNSHSYQAHSPASAIFPLITGFIVLFGVLSPCSRASLLPSALALASLPMLATLFKTRSASSALAGAVPLLGSYVFLYQQLLAHRPTPLNQDWINLVTVLVSTILISVLIWKKITQLNLQKLGLSGEVLLHSLALFALHLFFQKHLILGADFFASSLLGLSLLFISRRFPFRMLSALSWFPIIFAIFSGLQNHYWQGVAQGQLWFIAAACIVGLQLLLATAWIKKGLHTENTYLTDTLWLQLAPLASFITLGAWMLASLAATPEPWQIASLSAVALLYTSLWSWKKIESLGPLSLAPLSLAALMSFQLMLNQGIPSNIAQQELWCILINAAAFLSNGIFLAQAQRRLLKQKITSTSALPWLHAILSLSITFIVCATDHLVNEKLTVIFWGIAAITLFIGGLFAGLRAYRLTGLTGLLLCIAHIFIWDIQDTLYRIFAFFVIGVVLIIIGFLYVRFRDRIATLDS